MKYIDEYRDGETAKKYAAAIKDITTRSWTIMEVCGGQTHAIIRFGIQDLLPPAIHLVHGPGCPVCVTPLEMIDKALAIAARPEVLFCTFGDMLRVPGSCNDLQSLRAGGSDVRIVYSPLDCLQIAKDNPAKEIVFFAVGFETTAPGNAMLVRRAAQQELKNLSVLVSHVLVPPAIEAILSSKQNKVQGFLAAGHVCTIMGTAEYEPLATKYKAPIVATGFEPLDILQGLYMCIKQLEEGQAEVENQYIRAVAECGNRPAQDLIREVFRVIPRKWRGIGPIPQSGWGLAGKYENFDAERRFSLADTSVEEPPECISGLVLQGIKKPSECSAFGKSCTFDHPLGAPMVSGEGACAAYYKYRRHDGT
ncbi:hydrogenase formation protein HypD [Nitrosococcus oceani]|uniref:hydrogenase formation protein HypD n=1 Tax=Nitrosococcus oceani TaxID=1229 RepID=UPI0004E96DFC|nr:hydrogenase formation protein HypD [Nitrosococcus oceani]KFI21626.1 hydrogenase formation protein HupD [Nitrosococcus oceani]